MNSIMIIFSGTTSNKFKFSDDIQQRDDQRKVKNNANKWWYVNLQMAKWQMDWHFRTFRKYTQRDRQQPVLCTNFPLRCFVHSIAVCLRNSLMITSLALDGIPLAANYLRILSDGLVNNRNLRSLSLARCQIGDTGWLTLYNLLFSNC